VEKVLAFDPEHLSAYSLKVEPGTPFFQLEQSGNLDLPGEDREAEMFEWLRERVQRAGYVHYEISNFAKPGFAAQHNLAYWQNEEYLGLGPAAYSGLRGVDLAEVFDGRLPAWPLPMPATAAAAAAAPLIRFGNRSDLKDYLHSVRQFKSPVGFTEVISPALEKAETMFLGLRLLKGVNKAAFKERFGVTVEQAFPGIVDQLLQKGLLRESEECLALSDRAILLANQVFQEFLP
jgi:oxygen-independent coproporphyrinogen-3 oxidase